MLKIIIFFSFQHAIYEDLLGRIWLSGWSSAAGYKICIVLDNIFNILYPFNYNKINISNFVTSNKFSDIYDNSSPHSKYYNL